MFLLEIYDYETNILMDVLYADTLREAKGYLCNLKNGKDGGMPYYDYEKEVMMDQRYKGHVGFIRQEEEGKIKGYRVFLEAYPLGVLY
ncbi:hypothetical protein [Pseudobacillus badius]|uniref:hypothetical protein n=1 Tax=Bacillus badius TaxID=1455 RepID=UPI0007B084BD|nr:hypothetical protein [Bacillus badius]KZN98579.1 hypothetical protein A4244_19620 [Bacillus badius]OCS83465.1 hypothetical protein A6M11_19635 [Bacillus badius]OVE46402.1 hypothetical protein B1A98_19585 [Bacillus badius]TDV97909.1 hypothetical protein B0G66_1334 [Bacillus badius]